MNRLLFLLIFLQYSGLLFAQNGYPFPTDEAEWHVTRVSPILGPDDAFDRWVYRVGGETLVIDSTTYVAVAARGTCHSDQSTSYQYEPYVPAQYAIVGGLRQEGDSIFFFFFSFPPFTGAPSTIYAYPLDQEVLLYDFSLEIGDTIEYVTPDRTFVVTDVMVNSQGRKEIQLSSFGCGYPINVLWREGQGCTNGLLETICFYYYAGSCFSSAATGEPPCSIPCTPDDPVLVATTSPAGSGSVRVHPNPTSGILHLSISDPLAPMELTLLDITGQPVLVRQAVRDQDTLDLSGLAPGSYICQVSSPRGEFQVFKVVRLP